MFDIKSIVFRFPNVSLYCVGSETDIDMLIRFLDVHKSSLNPNVCIDRIVFHSIYTRLVATNFLFAFKYWKYNHRLKINNLLMNLYYFDEAMFISEPKKYIEAVEFQSVYGSDFKISQYWRDRFPHLPNKFTIVN